jgi:hypothetical protein
MSTRRRSYRCFCCRAPFTHAPEDAPVLCPACTEAGCAPWYRPACCQNCTDDPATWGVAPLERMHVSGPGRCQSYYWWPERPPIERELYIVP